MKKNIISIIGIMFLLTISLFILTSCSNDESYRIVKIFSYTGNCQVVRENNTLAVQKDMKLKNNDELQVSASSNAILKLDNDKFVNVKENTNVKLEATGKENKTKTRLHVLNGGVIVEVKEKLKDDEAFEIASSNSVMAIRGTQISFDVDKTEDSITSTFSILKGETEIFLYKDENMDSTSLIHDYMMSYTTSLIKSTDEIYKIYDRGGFKKLTDDELFEKYGIKKKPISNDRINEIVKSVNDFEKEEDEIVNGVLNFDIPTEISYNVNPKDVVALLDDNRYIDLLNVKFLYSSSIDGTYNEYDSSNPLSVGTWYCKVDAGNAYVSEAIEFSVVKAKVNFEIGDSVAYKTNPNTIINVSGNYSGLKYLYSSTVDGVYAEYSETNPLPTGTYYAKVENDNYTSTPKQFRVTQASISISLLSDSVAYKTNPTTIIKVEGASGTLTYKYGTSRTNLSRTYTASNPLAIGTWYVQVSIGTQTTSNILEFNVVPAKLDASLASGSVEYQTNPSTIVTINGTYSNIQFLYSTSETGEFNEYDTENPLDVGLYYLKVVSGNEYISDILDFEITPKEITFNLGNSVTYGVNPSTIITITNGTYPDATYLYRKDGSNTDVEFDSDSPFEVGTWYVTVDNGSNYVSSRKSFEIVAKEIVYSLTSTTVPYGTNPNTIVSVSGSENYPTITYKYSTSENGTYSEYNVNNPLATRSYYIKLFINDNYYSVAKEFNVGKMSFDFTISSEIEYNDSIIE
ncbi:MAG: FecR family protein, partial [bacterium]|nr:FecR family protein [bacterium]